MVSINSIKFPIEKEEKKIFRGACSNIIINYNGIKMFMIEDDNKIKIKTLKKIPTKILMMRDKC
jgi:hypothetical protein